MATPTTYVGNSNGDMPTIPIQKIPMNTPKSKNQKILHKLHHSSGPPIKMSFTESSPR